MLEFNVRGVGKVPDAVVSEGGREEARVSGGEGQSFRLESEDGRSWDLDPRVHGEIRPFSMRVSATGRPGEPVLTIRNHVFFHGGKPYMMTGIPEDVTPADHVLGRRHINRLDTFPFSTLEEIDPETWGRLRRHRGVSVGTFDGLGLKEFRVRLAEELGGIALPLVAASYLLYSTG